MGDEQEAHRAAACGAQSPVVERGDNRLARTGRSDDQVPPAAMTLALDLELLQYPRLVGVRHKVER